MKKLFQAIRKGEIETVRQLIEKKPELVNCIAHQPPKKDDGQSTLQIALKTGRLEIAHLLLNSGADVNFIEGPDSCDDWRMPVLNHAVLTAGMSCRHTVCTDLGDCVLKEEVSSQEKADAAYALLRRILEMGADISQRESFGTSCAGRLCKTAEELLPSYNWGERRVSPTAEVTSECEHDLMRLFLLLKEYGADFSEEKQCIEGEKEQPLHLFLDRV